MKSVYLLGTLFLLLNACAHPDKTATSGSGGSKRGVASNVSDKLFSEIVGAELSCKVTDSKGSPAELFFNHKDKRVWLVVEEIEKKNTGFEMDVRFYERAKGFGEAYGIEGNVFGGETKLQISQHGPSNIRVSGTMVTSQPSGKMRTDEINGSCLSAK